ncbi:MAG: hypothetical protein IKJ01_02190 [Lachnospiraceae bacterium]|nr:hypothetical protein [Lachnospiraceae bacterium]
MLKRINDALPGLVFGILLYGGILQITGMWFVEDKVAYSIGLWYGIAIAIGMGINLAVVIYDAVTFDGTERANGRIVAKSLLRYLVVAVLFFILGYFNFGNLFSAFLGAMGLKISAYMQPLLNKAKNKLTGRPDAAFCDEGKENLNKEVTL